MRKIIIEDALQIAIKAEPLVRYNIEFVVVGYYGTVIDIVNHILKCTDATLSEADIHDYDYDGYEDAYYVEFYNGEIDVGRAYVENGNPVGFEVSHAFVEEDFVDDFLKANREDGVCVFGFDDVHEEETKKTHGDYPCVCMTDDETGFTFCDCKDGNHVKFTYKGCKKLSDEDIITILDREFS